jgi:hypothetical protein
MGDTNLPTAIRIRIQLANENGNVSINQQPIEMLVPLLSQSRTNQPTTTTSTTGS